MIGAIKDIRSKPFLASVYLLLLLGFGLRLWTYFEGRGFFMDESNLIRTIYDHTFSGLFGPLDHGQHVPPLFAFDLKLMATFFGVSEYSMRFTSLLAGGMSLYLMYRLANRYTQSIGLVYSTGMMASSYLMIRYSTEAKQYIIDVFVCLTLVELLHIYREDRRSLPLLTFGVIAVWFSMPSVFILFGMGLYLMSIREYRNTGFLLSALSLISFSIYYYYLLQPSLSSEALMHYHTKNFLHASFSKDVPTLVAFFGNSVGKTGLLLIGSGIFLLAGSYKLYHTNKKELILYVAPFIAICFAAALHRYSLIPRMTIFIFPLIWLLLGIGIESLWNRIKDPNTKRIFLGVFVGFSILSFVSVSPLKIQGWPMSFEELGKTLPKIKPQKNEVILLTPDALASFDLYNRVHKKAWKFTGAHKVVPLDQIAISIDSVLLERKSVLVVDSHTFGEEKVKLDETLTSFETRILAQEIGKKASIYRIGKR